MNDKHRMIVLLDADLWTAFSRACEAEDQSASQVVRALVRKYVNSNAQTQLPLTAPAKRKPVGKSK